MLKVPTPMQCQVRRAHLKQLAQVHDLLQALNDPYVSPEDLHSYLERLPVLAGRCIRRAANRAPTLRIEDLGQVLGIIGNRGLEAELLQLLEDLTILKSETD